MVYEIEHVAYSSVPRLSVSDYPPLVQGKPTRLTLFVKNTVERDVRVRVSAVTSAALHVSRGLKAAEETKESGGSGTADISTAAEVWAVLPSAASCEVALSSDWVWLPAYDEIAEESGVLHNSKRPDSAPADNTSVSQPQRTNQRASSGCELRELLCCTLTPPLCPLCRPVCAEPVAEQSRPAAVRYTAR